MVHARIQYRPTGLITGYQSSNDRKLPIKSLSLFPMYFRKTATAAIATNSDARINGLTEHHFQSHSRMSTEKHSK